MTSPYETRDENTLVSEAWTRGYPSRDSSNGNLIKVTRRVCSEALPYEIRQEIHTNLDRWLDAYFEGKVSNETGCFVVSSIFR